MALRRIIVTLLLVSPLHIAAQEAASLSYYDGSYEEYMEYSPEELKQKYHKFSAVRNLGFSFIGVSVACLITGITLMATSDIQTWEETKAGKVRDTSGNDDTKFAVGIFLVVPAVPLAAAGITLAAIGGSKRREYKHKLVMRGIEANMSARRPAFALQFDLY